MAPSSAHVSVPQPDFSLQFSSNSVAVAQGTTTSSLTISVAPQNGFSGTVQVTLSGLPSGVATNPPSPFSIAAGASTVPVVGASANAATGTFTITAAATSGSLSHSAMFSLNVNPGAAANLPRTAYARTDAVPGHDSPAGEPPHRHIAYDPANKHVFVANRAMNRVEVFSNATQTRVAQIGVPGASSADLSPDGSLVWIGTVTEQAAAIDTATLQVRARYSIPAMSVTGSVFDRPEELLGMASGKLMVRMRQSGGSQSLLALWDPVANSVLNLSSVAPQVFQNGLGVMAHSGDRSKLFIAANDSTGLVAILDGGGNLLAGPVALGPGTIPAVAANPNGSSFAAELVSGSGAQLFLLNGSLHQLATPAFLQAQSLTFSRDGLFLFASQNSSGPPDVSVLNASTLALLGEVPDVAIQGIRSQIEDADETQLVFGIANRGVSFIDASQPTSLPTTAPSFSVSPVAQPSEGLAAGGTNVILFGQHFESAAQVTFGPQLATNVSVTGATQIQAATPATIVNGPVNVAAYFQSGSLAIAPDAFSYGPHIMNVLPNAGNTIGSDLIRIYGYGFGANTSNISVKIGGAVATVQQVQNVTSIAASLGLDTTYPFPVECITLLTPPGSPGKADLIVTSAAGTTTAANGFQYVQSEQVFAKPALYKFILYDHVRQWLYLSATDHVDVFDLASTTFKSPLTVYCPSQKLPGPCPDAALRGMSLTPDGSQLLVADFGSQNVFLLNPDAPGTVNFTPTGGIPGFSASGPALIAATSTQTAFVSMSGEGGTSGACNSCLSQLNLATTPPSVEAAPQPQVSSVTGAPLIKSSASGNEVFLAYETSAGGPVGLWSASAPNQFTISTATEYAIDLAAAPDGTGVATRAGGPAEIRDANLTLNALTTSPELEQVPSRVWVPGAAMHPSGALLYQPFLTGAAPSAPPATGIQGGIDILDAHSGILRLRVYLPEPFAMLSTDTDALHGSFFALDENGQRLFALTTSGLTTLQLANVPLGIGTISPASGSASGGVALTIRGSGFQSGTTVTIGGKSAAVTFTDMNTLSVVTPSLSAGPQQVIVSNPDRETVSLDAAFTVN